VGLRPTTPHKLAGWRIDPPVSDPNAAKHRDATAAADHLPPGTRRSHGLTVRSPNFSVLGTHRELVKIGLPRITASAVQPL
jgi:hypothetical protein